MTAHHYRTPVLCGRCGREIEHCYGDQTDWMHTSTRREHCKDGRLATPETVEQYDLRTKGTHNLIVRRAKARKVDKVRRASQSQIRYDPEFAEWKRSRSAP